MPSDVDVEALLGGPEFLGRSQMPFACEEGRIALCLERFGGRRLPARFGPGSLRERHAIMERRRVEAARTLAGEIVRRVNPRRILAGHDTETCRAADGISRIPAGKAHAASCQPIDIACLVKRVGIVCSDVHVSQVVDEDKDDIRPGCLCALGLRRVQTSCNRQQERKDKW